MRLKKVSRVIFVILILIFIFSMLLWSIPFGRAESLKITAEEVIALEKDNISSGQILLPGNPFYFLKNWAWGIKKIFTADKINWHLGFTASKLLDIKKLLEKNPDNSRRIGMAIDYYEEASQKSEEFIKNSSSENKKTSLEKIVKNLIFYKKSFNNILSLQISDEIKQKIIALANQKDNYFIDFLVKSGDSERILKVFNNEISVGRGIFSGLRDLELETLFKKIFPSNSEIVSKFQNQLYIRTLSAFNNAYFAYGESFRDIISALSSESDKRQELWDWNARSGQDELFEKILGDMTGSYLNSEETEKCLTKFDSVKKELSIFKDFIGNGKVSSNVEYSLIMAEGTLKHGGERIEMNNKEYACNLIQNSQAMISNGWRLVKLAYRENILLEITKVEGNIAKSKNIAQQYEQNKNQRLFDLITQMEKQFLSIQYSYNADNFEDVLQKIDQFEIILTNFNFVLDVLNGNKIIAQELGIKKEFFSADNLNRFNNLCSDQQGKLINNFVILPFCKLKSGEILMME